MARLGVMVTPRAKFERVVVDDEGLVKVWVTVPPAEGQANLAVVKLVAKTIGIAKSRVCLLDGAKSRKKTIEIEGLDSVEILLRLRE